MEKYGVFVKEPAVTFSMYLVEAEDKDEALLLAKEGKAELSKIIDVKIEDPNSTEFLGFDHALADIYYGDFDSDYPDYPHGSDEDEDE